MAVYGVIRALSILVAVRISQGYEFRACFAEVYTFSCSPENTTISITSAQYGVSGCPAPATCCPQPEADCLIQMIEGHLVQLEAACEGKKQCTGNTPVQRDITLTCQPTVTDYALVKYDCITSDGSKVTTPSPGSQTGSQTDATVTMTAMTEAGYTREDSSDTDGTLTVTVVVTEAGYTGYTSGGTPQTGDDPSDTGVIVGIVVGCVLLLLVVVIVTMVIYVKRKQPAWADDFPKIRIPKLKSPMSKTTRSPPSADNRPLPTGTTRYKLGAVNPGFRTDSTISADSNDTLNEWSRTYSGAHVVRTPKDAIQAMKSSDENLAEENIYDVIGENLHRSVVPGQDPGASPDRMAMKHTRGSIPSEVAPDIPDVVPRQPSTNGPRQLSGAEQVTINDDVYYCPVIVNPSPRDSGDEEIYDDNLHSRSSNSGSRTSSNYVRPLEFRPESQYADLQPHLMTNEIYSKMSPPQEVDYLDEDNPQGAYYLDVIDDQYPGRGRHTDI